jgi:hypothetical protein
VLGIVIDRMLQNGGYDPAAIIAALGRPRLAANHRRLPAASGDAFGSTAARAR